MLNKFLLLACFLIVALGLFAVPFPDGPVALIAAVLLSTGVLLTFRRFTEEREFVTTIFLVGLALRLSFGLLVHIFDLREFFGGDALQYDANGAHLVDIWLGKASQADLKALAYDPAGGTGWGMNYLTGFIYLFLGRNIFAAQSFCAVAGAATAPMVFFCAKKIFNNLRVAKFAAVSIAVFPSFVIWSSQLLKDGLIIFLLVLTMTMVLELQKKFNYAALSLVIASLLGIVSLRFYIFYMVIVAVVGSFLIGTSTSNKSMFRRIAVIVLMGVALLYLGVRQRASIELSKFANLERIQISRSHLVRSSVSGFGEDVDVSTTEGALSALPTGFAYLMFAPFPWQAANLRQAITIPEVLLWWAMFPFMIAGLVYSVRNRLRNAFPVLIFSLLLTLSYSLLQGNVGTAYRQRTQIQVFLFIFVGVGWTVYQEQRENKRLLRAAAQRQVENNLRAGLQMSK
ncbi:MAG: glycosyltransferase family 39 protein [Chloracidobacterium sp.]|nr:glycosyltransferase family 39 protein [Chloracidobacterium sp.]